MLPLFRVDEMRIAFLLVFIATVRLADVCLVIGYSEPPACACQAKKLDASNIFRSIQSANRKYYVNVTTSMIKAPELVTEDCMVSMYCEGEYKLFIFDTDKDEFLGDYGVDGFCNPFAQKWQIDTGDGMKTYNQLMGVCVLKTICPCPYLQLDNSNAKYYLENNTHYKETLQYYRFQPADIKELSADGCQRTRSCPEGLEEKSFIANKDDSYMFPTVWTESTCRMRPINPWSLRWWRPTVVQTDPAQFFAPICVDFSQRIDP